MRSAGTSTEPALSQLGEPPLSKAQNGGEYSGSDVLVQAEEVVGVVAPLESHQPLVLIRPVGRQHPLLTLVHEKVHVDLPRAERLHRLEEALRPPNVRLRRPAQRPPGVDVEEEWLVAVAEGGAAWEARCRTAQVGDLEVAER